MHPNTLMSLKRAVALGGCMKLITNKNLELQRLVGIQTNTLKNSGVTVIEGRGKVG